MKQLEIKNDLCISNKQKAQYEKWTFSEKNESLKTHFLPCILKTLGNQKPKNVELNSYQFIKYT